MKQENLVYIIVALLVGLLGGFLIFSISNKSKTAAVPPMPMGSGSPADYSQRITEAEKIVAKDPKTIRFGYSSVMTILIPNSRKKLLMLIPRLLK